MFFSGGREVHFRIEVITEAEGRQDGWHRSIMRAVDEELREILLKFTRLHWLSKVMM